MRFRNITGGVVLALCFGGTLFAQSPQAPPDGGVPPAAPAAPPSEKHLLKEGADVSLKFAQDWANKLSDQVIADMRDELKKRGHAL